MLDTSNERQEKYAEWAEKVTAEATPKIQTPEDQWHFDRRLGIGGSDMGAVLGMSPYKTPYDVWLEKTGRKEPEDISDKLQVRVGNKSEQIVAEFYAEDHNLKVRRAKQKSMALAPWIRANPDRLIVGERKGLECKTGRLSPAWGETGTDEVPMGYVFQVYTCMAVFDYRDWDLAALLAGPQGSDLRYYPFKWDDAVVEPMLARASDWWFNHVIADVPPDPVCQADVAHRYPVDNGEAVIASQELATAIDLYRDLQKIIKDNQLMLEDVKLEIQTAIGDNTEVKNELGLTLATWKKSKDSAGFDWRALTAEHPELEHIFKQYRKTTPGARRLNIK